MLWRSAEKATHQRDFLRLPLRRIPKPEKWRNSGDAKSSGDFQCENPNRKKTLCAIPGSFLIGFLVKACCNRPYLQERIRSPGWSTKLDGFTMVPGIIRNGKSPYRETLGNQLAHFPLRTVRSREGNGWCWLMVNDRWWCLMTMQFRNVTNGYGTLVHHESCFHW